MRLKVQVAPAAEHDLELLLREHHAIIEKQDATSSQVPPLMCPCIHVMHCRAYFTAPANFSLLFTGRSTELSHGMGFMTCSRWYCE